jgi:hypothetical protein
MKNKLVKRLAEIDAEKAKSLRLPPVTEMMVDEVINNVHSILDTTEPQELKVALSHFIEKIEMNGKETTIFYSVILPVKEKVLNFGDPGGSTAVGTFKAHLVLDMSCLPRSLNI